jgi:hypothetical protein
MPELVEQAGTPLWATGLRWRIEEFGRTTGEATVGGVAVGWTWRRDDPGGIEVRHPAPLGALAALMGLAPEEQQYRVGLVRDFTPAGGRRLWLACTGCGRARKHLYLCPGRSRLSCRTCHGLRYLSQATRDRRPRGRRKRGDGVFRH